MYKRLDRAHRAIPLVLGVVTLISVGVLLARDVNPKFFAARAHDFLAAFPLAMIAVAYLLYQSVRRPAAKVFVKAIMLAVAFLFLFFLGCQSTLARFTPSDSLQRHCHCALRPRCVWVMIGWPTTSPDESFAETYVEKP